MQLQADLLQVPVVRPRVTETTAMGAAYLAGLATGFWKSREEIRHTWQAERTFEPQLSPDAAAHRRHRWAEALNRARGWEESPPLFPTPMNPYLAEFLGTMLLVLFGNGVVANVVLARTKGHNSGWIVITAGWAVAVFVGAFCAARPAAHTSTRR